MGNSRGVAGRFSLDTTERSTSASENDLIRGEWAKLWAEKMPYSITEDVRLMTCHINSVARDGLNGQTPFDLAELLLSEKVLTSV